MKVDCREKVLWELGDYGGNPSCDSYNYAMRRAAETFFPVWDKDRSFAMFERCCDMHALGVEQRLIVRRKLEQNGFTE